jgi:hypothetical protein
MKKIFLLAATVFSIAALRAQTVDDVVNKYMEAIGGKDKLTGIKSVYMEGISVMQNGNEINSKLWRVQDKLYRREINFGMGSITMIATPKEGWRSNPRNGGAFEAMSEEQLKASMSEMECVNPMVNYAAKGHTAVLEGKETVEGKDCHKIKLTLKSGGDVTYFIDATTHLLVRETKKGGGFGGGARPGGQGGQGGGDRMQTIDYSDYQKSEYGVLFPMSFSMGGMMGKTTVEKLEVNKEVDAKLYKPE